MAEDRDHGGLERRLEAWAEAGAIDLRPEVHRAVSATLKRDLRPVKPLPSIGVRAGQFLAGFGVCAAALMAMLGKAGFHMMPARQMAGMGILLRGGAVYFAFQLAGQMAPGGRLVASSVLGPLLLSAGVGASMATLFPWRMPQAFAREGWPCALLEVMIAAPAVALFWLVARRGVLFASAGLGAALTAISVSLGLMVDQAQCMFPEAPHLLAWHLGTAVSLVAVGALLGRAMEGRQP